MQYFVLMTEKVIMSPNNIFTTVVKFLKTLSAGALKNVISELFCSVHNADENLYTTVPVKYTYAGRIENEQW